MVSAIQARITELTLVTADLVGAINVNTQQIETLIATGGVGVDPEALAALDASVGALKSARDALIASDTALAQFMASVPPASA